jgi:hypothetical protein
MAAVSGDAGMTPVSSGQDSSAGKMDTAWGSCAPGHAWVRRGYTLKRPRWDPWIYEN